jgi:hypothetical protein
VAGVKRKEAFLDLRQTSGSPSRVSKRNEQPKADHADGFERAAGDDRWIPFHHVRLIGEHRCPCGRHGPFLFGGVRRLATQRPVPRRYWL